MSRKQLIRTSEYPYHVVARTNNKVFFRLPIAQVFDFFTTWLNFSHVLYETQTHHFKLMSNHFHWILKTPQKNLGRVVNHLLTNISKDINMTLNTQDHTFGLRYQWSIIKDESHYACNVKYLYRNSIRAGICDRVEDYPYSTLGFYLGLFPCPIMVTHDAFMSSNDICEEPLKALEFLEWLNTPSQKEEEEMMRKGIKQPYCEFYKRRRSRPYQLQDLSPFS